MYSKCLVSFTQNSVFRIHHNPGSMMRNHTSTRQWFVPFRVLQYSTVDCTAVCPSVHPCMDIWVVPSLGAAINNANDEYLMRVVSCTQTFISWG